MDSGGDGRVQMRARPHPGPNGEFVLSGDCDMAIDVSPAAMLDLFRPIHEKLRADLAGLEPEILNWRPGPETNSVGALILHIVTTERRNLVRITGSAPEGDEGEAESTPPFTAPALLALLDGADAFL